MIAESKTTLSLTINREDLMALLLEHNGIKPDTGMLKDFDMKQQHGLIVLTGKYES